MEQAELKPSSGWMQTELSLLLESRIQSFVSVRHLYLRGGGLILNVKVKCVVEENVKVATEL